MPDSRDVPETSPSDDVAVRGEQRVVLKGNTVLAVEPPIRFFGRVQFSTDCRVGAFSYFNSGLIASCASIGRYCSIAGGIRVGDQEHPVNWLATSPFQYNNSFAFHAAGQAGRIGE